MNVHHVVTGYSDANDTKANHHIHKQCKCNNVTLFNSYLFEPQAAQVRSMTGDQCCECNYQESNILLNFQIIKVYMGTLSVVKLRLIFK